MAYGLLDPSLWDDDDFVALATPAAHTFLYLLTCRESVEGCPGIYQAGAAMIAEGLRFDVDLVRDAFVDLERVHLLERDESRRLIRLPRWSVSVRRPSNQRVLRGWFKRWSSLPSSPVKFRHLMTLAEGWLDADAKDWLRREWSYTFGTVRAAPARTRRADPNATPSPPGVGSLNGIDTVHSDPTSSSYSDPRSGAAPVPDDIARQALALWHLQERLRAEVPGLPPLPFDDSACARVAAALERWTLAQLEHAQRVFQSEAQHGRPEQLGYFNGVANWSPRALEVAVGKAVMMAPAADWGGEADYSGGDVLGGETS